jgi:hypothetical protein
MDIAEKIYNQVSRLPEHLAREVLDFIEYLEKKHGIQDHDLQNLKEAQVRSMNNVWNNEEDEVWNDHPAG